MKKGIYKITSPLGRVYIGQSKNLIKREEDYQKLNCKKQIRLYNSIKKHGWENHKFEIIEYCSTEILNERERYWQEYYDVLSRKGLNCFFVNTSDKQMVMSDFIKKKISKSRKGKFSKEENPFYGKRHTQETKDKISKANSGVNSYNYGKKGILSHNYGRKHSKEVNQKKGRKGELNPFIGRKHSDESKQKISKAKKGKKTLGENHKARKVLDISSGIIYNSVIELYMILDNVKYDTLRHRIKTEKYGYKYI